MRGLRKFCVLRQGVLKASNVLQPEVVVLCHLYKLRSLVYLSAGICFLRNLSTALPTSLAAELVVLPAIRFWAINLAVESSDAQGQPLEI